MIHTIVCNKWLSMLQEKMKIPEQYCYNADGWLAMLLLEDSNKI